MKALWIYWVKGDDEVELTDEESSDDKDEVAEWIQDYEIIMIGLDFYEWNKDVTWVDYEWYKALEDSELKAEALQNKAIMKGFIDDDDESPYEQKR
ncbi:hypothetical protein Tco_0659873 [Tanacetum coccineum]